MIWWGSTPAERRPPWEIQRTECASKRSTRIATAKIDRRELTQLLDALGACRGSFSGTLFGSEQGALRRWRRLPPVVRLVNELVSLPNRPSLPIRNEQQRWRERTLRGVALAMLPCYVLVALWYLVVQKIFPELIFVFSASALAMVAVVLVRSLPFVLRTALVLGTLYAPCVVALLLGGYSPNPFIAFGMICVTGTLLLGRRAGLALLVACALTVAGVGFVHTTHRVERVATWQRIVDSTVLATTVRITFIFTLVTATLVLAVSYLLSRSEELVAEKERSLETLRREQAERERIAHDLELREAAFQKARELELLGRLAGSMAHDFNNALLVIWASLDELALLPTLPRGAESPLADLRTAADQASATTKQLRAFGPMAPRRPSELALTPSLQKAKAMFARVLPQNIKLELDLRLDAVIVADEGELLRVLMNLALNARDAMRDGGKLVIRVRPPTAAESGLPLPKTPEPAPDGTLPAGVVVIEVEDTGSGMTDEVKARIFEPFFTTKQAAGTGLGLASTRDLLVAQGGHVEIASESGVGTTVSLLWPAVHPRGEQPVERPLPASAEPLVVLLVDDDDAVRLALRRSLTRAGMTVLDAADGASALTLARRQKSPIHLLCTDCVMPGPPVRKLIADFRELHAGRVLVCSGYAPAETGLSPDVFDDFLPKPFSGETLVARVHAVLRAPATAS
jgi:signal transduction histidine kinase